MAAKRRDRVLEKRTRKRKAKQPVAPRKKAVPAEPTIQTRFGELRVRHVRGHPVTWRTYELVPGEMKKLPPGSVRGSPLRQVFGLGGPHLFYVDIERRCRSCRRMFVFSAKEQRHWYETLKFFECSTAIDCQNCRRDRRTARKLLASHSEVSKDAQSRPEDPRAQLQLAKSTFALRMRLGRGNLASGIAAARRAKRLSPRLVESLYWEGRLHELAQRPDRARKCLEEFTREASKLRSKAMAKMKREANLLLGKGKLS